MRFTNGCTAAAMSAAMAVLTIGSVQNVGAQEAGAALEEVTVSATRRTETNLQVTPISVSAITAGDLERTAAKDISAMALQVPGFSASRITAFNAASFAMRGVGLTDIIVYQDSPVGVQYDDFVMPSVQTQLLDTFDVASAEVLRGPQGTTFGKNTTGGAVNIRSKRPNMDTAGGELRISAGKFGEQQYQAAVDMPVAPGVFSMRAVGSYIKSDGYYKLGATYGPISSFNTNPALGATTGAASLFTIPGITGTSGRGTGESAGGQDVFSGRLKAQWNASENLTALLQFEVMKDRSDAVPSFNDTPVGAPYLWNFLGFTRPTGDPLNNMASTNRNDSLLEMGKGQKIDVEGAYLNLDWKLGNYTLYSVSGYRKQDEHLPNTYTGAAPVNAMTGAPLSLFDATRDTTRITTQQELRIASNLDGAFNFVGGGFYQRNDAKFCVVQLLGFVDLIQNWGAAGLPQQLLNNLPQVLCNEQKSDSLAGFIDGDFKINEKFTIGAGIRYTQDEKEWTGRTQTGFSAIDPMNPNLSASNFTDPLQAGNWALYPGAPFNAATCTASFATANSVYTCAPVLGVARTLNFSNLKTKWSEPSWRVTGSWQINDAAFAYLTVSEGYKAGGYNDQTGTSGILVPELTRPVNPEFARNYELGFKTEWMDKRIRFNPTIFYTKYSDAQRAANVITVKQGAQFQETVFYNAAEVTSKGIEVELQAAVTDHFQVRVAASKLDAKYDSFILNQPAITAADGSQIIALNQNLSGLPVPRSPKFSASLTAIYNWDLSDSSKLQLTGEFYHEDANLFYISAAGRAYDAYLDAKDLINLSLGWTSANGQWSARLYGKNLSDERYRVASQSVATLWTHSQFGEPRNYGLQLGYKFGGGK